jgi:ketosteroid isomerase-like protein
MDDARAFAFEASLWTGDAAHYAESIDAACLMVLPAAPFIVAGQAAVEAVAATPRWGRVEFTERRVSRPEDGLIVIAYIARTEREGAGAYEAYCSSVYRRRAHGVWRVVHHQQTPRPIAPAATV